MKIKVIGLMLIAAFFTVSCGYTSMISGLVGSDKKESSSNSTKSDSSASNEGGWNKNADGTWTYTPEKPRTVKLSNNTTSFELKNGLSEKITAVYVKASGVNMSSGWGDNCLGKGYTITPGGNYLNLPISNLAQNDANKFDIRVNTGSGKTYEVKGVTIPKDGSFTFK
ncbi:MAG: hypothetical protein FWF73_05025 [Spirochaetes bacterium]|nr:hypothetical protein [Spirochaetota bacterium]